MDKTERACLFRCRMGALLAMTSAGGLPRPAQLRRAVEPILGDLLEQLDAADRRSAKTTAARSGRLPTVDTRKRSARKCRA